MQQARIKANTRRAKEALFKIHKKEGKPLKEKLLYKGIMEEYFTSDKMDELIIKPRNERISNLIPAREFINSIAFDFARYNIDKKDYEVFIDD